MVNTFHIYFLVLYHRFNHVSSHKKRECIPRHIPLEKPQLS